MCGDEGCCKDNYVTIDLECSDEVMDRLEYISADTGFSISKIVEYILGEQIIRESLSNFKV